MHNFQSNNLLLWVLDESHVLSQNCLPGGEIEMLDFLNTSLQESLQRIASL